MQHIIGTSLGKIVQKMAHMRGGGGQALPGLVVEKLLPRYLASMLGQLPDGVIVITGTNGKTTTTKMVVELLQANGKRVLTNPTGSNFTRGIISSLTQQAHLSGHLPFDIGVFELDEAYAWQFVQQVKPRWVVALNVMRDQLDRFGELDTAARLIGQTMHEATTGIVVNDDDSRLAAIAKAITAHHPLKSIYFGVSPELRAAFPTDDELVAVTASAAAAKPVHARAAELTAFTTQKVSYRIAGATHSAPLQLTGQHNFQNAAAALALLRALLPSVTPEALVAQLATVKPAFGRGEQFTLRDGSTLHLILVKNPAGFRQSLASFPAKNKSVMLAVNDSYADGRDVSWLWDVDFSPLRDVHIALTTGSRAADMALRLQYDDMHPRSVNTDVPGSLRDFCSLPGDKLIFTTYTAMLSFYKLLKKEAGKTL